MIHERSIGRLYDISQKTNGLKIKSLVDFRQTLDKYPYFIPAANSIQNVLQVKRSSWNFSTIHDRLV